MTGHQPHPVKTWQLLTRTAMMKRAKLNQLWTNSNFLQLHITDERTLSHIAAKLHSIQVIVIVIAVVAFKTVIATDCMLLVFELAGFYISTPPLPLPSPPRLCLLRYCGTGRPPKWQVEVKLKSAAAGWLNRLWNVTDKSGKFCAFKLTVSHKSVCHNPHKNNHRTFQQFPHA